MNKSVVIPILNHEYKVIVCWGKDSYTKRIGKDWGHDQDTVLGERRGATYYHPRCHPVIVIKRKPKTPTEIGTLAHEAVHAVTNIFEKIDERSWDEIYASSVGAIVREVLKTKD